MPEIAQDDAMTGADIDNSEELIDKLTTLR